MKNSAVRQDGYQTLSVMEPGDRAIVARIDLEGGIRRRLLDLGFTEGTAIRCVLKHRTGENAAYLVRGTAIALRKEDAAGILVL